MSSEILLARIAQHPNLPSPPHVALKVLEMASRPDCSMADIAHIINHDPGLCASLLKIVNSALYSVPRTITSLSRALNMLGLKRVRALVLSLSLPSMQRRRSTDSQTQNFWKASVAGAVAARELSIYLRRPDPETDMVTALLRDVGFLILQEVHPDVYGELCAYPPAQFAEKQCALEHAALGVDHAAIGAHVLRHWRLPQELTDPIKYHHSPAHAAQNSVALHDQSMLLYFAHLIGQLQVTPDVPALVQSLVDLGRARFSLADQRLHKFLKPLQQKIEDVARLLDVDIGKCHDYNALVANTSTILTSIVVETSVENLRMQEEKTKADQDLRQAEQALRESEEQVRHAVKMEAIGRLAGGIAHDFNNLLTVINGYSEMLQSAVPAGSPARRFVEQIRGAGDRAAALTKQLLAFGRKQVMQPVTLDLKTVITNLSEMMSRLLGARIEVVQKLDPKLNTIRADPGQIDQVLINLLLNARDAMPNGGTITIEAANVKLEKGQLGAFNDVAPGSYVVLTLSDNGCGMDDNTKAHAFEPFFTTKDKGKGTGLGLAMVYGIIKQSGGHVTLQSQKGKGTTFSIYLPVSNDTQTVILPAAKKPARGGETILVAEDDDAIRDIVSQTLKSIGYTVLDAADGQKALEVAKHHPGHIHLLLTDLLMPSMDGYELAKQFQAIRPRTRICYMSGFVDDRVAPINAIETTGTFLAKPFSPSSLAGRVQEMLAGASSGEFRRPDGNAARTQTVLTSPNSAIPS